MTCERHYTPAVVAELQAVLLAVELRRWAYSMIVDSNGILNRPDVDSIGAIYVNGKIDILDLLLLKLGELAPDYSQCDNPPE